MAELTRREALKSLGTLSLGATFAFSEAQLGRAARAMAQLGSPRPQSAVRSPQFFTAREWRLVRMLSDYVIPADERSGSATDAKVPEFIDVLMSDPDASIASRTAIRGGLAWIDGECRSRFRKVFVEATDAQRREVLDDIAWPRRAKPEFSHGVVFFSRFRDLVASGFFSSAMGWRDVQYQGNVFNPDWNGCPPAAMEKLGVSPDVMVTRVAPR